jgi:comEA protein
VRLIVAIISFAFTLGVLFLFDRPNNGSINNKLAQILISPIISNRVIPESTPINTLVSKKIIIKKDSTLTPVPTGVWTITATPILTLSPIVTSSPTTTAIPAPSVATQTATPMKTSPPPIQQIGLININTANLQELDKISGVGPAYAQNIIDYRTANGPFKKIEDVVNVKGIGPKTFEKMKNEITI